MGENMNKKPNSQTWDLVADAYGAEFTVFERDLASDIKDIFTMLGIDSSQEIAELGSGSGHLSGLLAQAGYLVALLDFSERSLDKSRQLFKKHCLSGRFLKRDIFDLDGTERFYLTWNSGVMEHFDDIALIEAFAAINRATDRFFVFLVPNSESLPYLLYRFKMTKQGRWNVGDEYLRKDYRRFLEQCGFGVREVRYCGWEITKNFYEYFAQDSEKARMFNTLVDNDLVPAINAYLTCYVCEKVKEVGSDPIKLPEPDGTDEITCRFDRIAGRQ